jgi:hypothetical protein
VVVARGEPAGHSHIPHETAVLVRKPGVLVQPDETHAFPAVILGDAEYRPPREADGETETEPQPSIPGHRHRFQNPPRELPLPPMGRRHHVTEALDRNAHGSEGGQDGLRRRPAATPGHVRVAGLDPVETSQLV